MCRFRSRCNTVPIEKGTETSRMPRCPLWTRRCNTVPIEKGTETVGVRAPSALDAAGCNTVPIEKGTETKTGKRLKDEVSRCNTVPIEKGTETRLASTPRVHAASDAIPSPSRRGLKRQILTIPAGLYNDAIPSPSRRGLKPTSYIQRSMTLRGCNTVPIEKGTETVPDDRGRALRAVMQYRPHREGD